MNIGHVLLVILFLALLGAFGAAPLWPHSQQWGYGPSGGLGVVVVVLAIVLLLR